MPAGGAIKAEGSQARQEHDTQNDAAINAHVPVTVSKSSGRVGRGGPDTKTDTKRVKISGRGALADYAWFPLRIGHFDPAIATKAADSRPAPPSELFLQQSS
jgi:hypothetical protein